MPSQNFAYMVQWWIFALIAMIGYPLILRRVARNRVREDQVPLDDPPEVPTYGREAGERGLWQARPVNEVPDVRERIMGAAIACVGAVGVRGVLARGRGRRGRACPGPRSTGTSRVAGPSSCEETATWEVARFWRRLPTRWPTCRRSRTGLSPGW